MSRPPYPGFPSYPPGDPRNAPWLKKLRAYNASVKKSNRRATIACYRIAAGFALGCSLVALWRTFG